MLDCLEPFGSGKGGPGGASSLGDRESKRREGMRRGSQRIRERKRGRGKVGPHLRNGSIRSLHPPADILEAPLDLRPEPQVREFSGLKSGGLEAAETLLTIPRLFRVRNGSRAVSSESGQKREVGGCRRGSGRRWDIEEGGGEGCDGEGEEGG